MKTKKEQGTKIVRNKYTAQFKEQAGRDGIRTVAKDLGLAEPILYSWRAKRRQTGQLFEEQKLQQAEIARLKRENARLEEEMAFLKKAAYFAKLPKWYAMIKANENRFCTGMMCRLLRVSRSGYYAWKHIPPSIREQSNRLLKFDIKRVFDDEKGEPGAPRVARRLKAEGVPAGRHRIARIMIDNGWRAKAARKYLDALGYKATTNSKHSLPVAPNLLGQDFSADKPDQKWVSDITYIWTDEGWLYLAVVLELFSRRVIGWAISERMTATLVCDALIMALWNRKMPKGVVVHSGRGSQYCSAVYQKLLRKHQLICSMSKKGDCYDNAAMVSWSHSFKVEAIYD